MVTCEYVATASDESTGHTDAEEVGGGVVTCSAEAEKVIRPHGKDIRLGVSWRQKKAVCRAHAQYLTSDDPDKRPDGARRWELDAADPEQIID